MTVFPFAEVGRHRWATMFKNLLASKRFDLKFMYAGLDGRAVRLVFSVTHSTNPIVNNHGLGKLLSATFPWFKSGNGGYVPVMELPDPASLAIAIAHVSTYRVTTEPFSDQFNPGNHVTGDMGDECAAAFVEWIRGTSCARMLRNLAEPLTPAFQTKVQSETLAVLRRHEVEFSYTDADPDKWTSKRKESRAISALIQVLLYAPSQFLPLV